jgi:2,3-bisphosphoglycerate-dependent phosphoglycerate mutase
VLARARDNALSNAATCRLQQDPDSATGWDVTDYNLRDHLREDAVTVTDEPSTGAGEES